MTLASLGYVTWFEIAHSENPYAIFIAIVRTMAPAMIFIAGVSVITTNVVEVIMGVAEWIREKTEKHREAMREEGREEGREQMRILSGLGYEHLLHNGAPPGVELPDNQVVAKLAQRGLIARHVQGGWAITEAGLQAFEQDSLRLYTRRREAGSP